MKLIASPTKHIDPAVKRIALAIGFTGTAVKRSGTAAKPIDPAVKRIDPAINFTGTAVKQSGTAV